MPTPRDHEPAALIHPMTFAALGPRLATVALAILLGCVGAANAQGSTSDVDEPRGSSEERIRELVGQRLLTLEDMLGKVQSTAAYKPLFESRDKGIEIMQAWFIRAQKSVHDVNRSIADGEWFEQQAADDFHNQLAEYLMNLDQLPTSMAFGATTTPDAGTKKKLRKAIGEIVEYAEQTPGFESVSVMELTAGSSAQDAVAYAKRKLTEVYVLLNNRTLTNVTSPGTEASADLRVALDAVWQALDGLVDSDGNHVVQTDDDNSPLKDQLAPFKAAMREARAQADFFRAYRPNAFPEAQVVRSEAIRQGLAASAFEKYVVAVKALKACDPVASPPVGRAEAAR